MSGLCAAEDCGDASWEQRTFVPARRLVPDSLRTNRQRTEDIDKEAEKGAISSE